MLPGNLMPARALNQGRPVPAQLEVADATEWCAQGARRYAEQHRRRTVGPEGHGAQEVGRAAERTALSGRCDRAECLSGSPNPNLTTSTFLRERRLPP